ncbi:MAG: aspartate kinase [Candidatus Omnitrophica bacterium]|nr:aspartate kinase [Candidatus Omnitrophota bacterium]MDD5441612.1 aspartate kinase [Candidatus Omnitrophota bacterium]
MAKKKLIVQKYGGSSVGNVDKLKNVADRVAACAKEGNNVVVVVSAMGDTTDELIELAEQINAYPSEREMDMLVSTGEQISSSLLAMALHRKDYDAISLTGLQVGILTDKYHTKAKILRIETKRIKKELNKNKIVIVAGYQGITDEMEITTLGRGGSDLSAVALAVALKADVCEIYTDVDGIYTADPRIITDARKIECIAFDEMLELAANGAQVIQTRAVEVAKKYNLPLHVRSSFEKKEGTIIMNKNANIEDPLVSGVALTEDEAKVTLCNVSDTPGIAAKVFNELANENINIDMIVQNVSRLKTTDISFTVLKSSLRNAVKKSMELAKKIGSGEVIVDEDIAKISVVGVGMKSHSGVAARCFSLLAKNKINIEMISTSEISISCVLKKSEGKKALKVLHAGFELESKKGSNKK